MDEFERLFEPGELQLVTRYGSTELDADIDVLLITKAAPTTNAYRVGRFDLLQLSEDQAIGLIQLMDPSMVEPLLTGQTSATFAPYFQRLRSILFAAGSDERTVRHHLRCSAREYERAANLSERLFSDSDRLEFLTTVSFAVSYSELARHYRQKNAAITIHELAKSRPLLARALHEKKRLRRNLEVLGSPTVNELLALVESCIFGIASA